MKIFTLNLLIAVIWLLLSHRRTTTAFFIGFFIGFVMIAAFNRVIGGGDYTRRSLAAVRFALIFAREFVTANLSVAAVVLFRRAESIHPNFLTYDVTGMRPMEILLLSYCITLTPGTTTVQISDDHAHLVVHALDTDRPDLIRSRIDRNLKEPILRFMR
jgi:multicomponent Na+:H+ antiporter subunit E